MKIKFLIFCCIFSFVLGYYLNNLTINKYIDKENKTKTCAICQIEKNQCYEIPSENPFKNDIAYVVDIKNNYVKYRWYIKDEDLNSKFWGSTRYSSKLTDFEYTKYIPCPIKKPEGE